PAAAAGLRGGGHRALVEPPAHRGRAGVHARRGHGQGQAGCGRSRPGPHRRQRLGVPRGLERAPGYVDAQEAEGRAPGGSGASGAGPRDRRCHALGAGRRSGARRRRGRDGHGPPPARGRLPGHGGRGLRVVLAVFRTELTKQLRRPRTFVALGIAFLIPVVLTIALKANPPSGGPGDQGLLELAPNSGLIVAVAALRFMSRFLLVLIAAVFAGDAVAAEAAWGNLRYLLVRPIRRSRLLGAKLGVSALFAVTATLLIVVVGLIAGGIAFGWSGV